MANTTKKKRFDRPAADPVQPGAQNSGARFYCFRCGTAFSRQKGFFPVSHSPMYRKAGYLPWCNDCVDAMYNEYREKLGDKDALRRMCMKMDLYWSDSIYDMVDRTSGIQSRIKNYIGKTNIIRFIDKTFDDTLAEESAKGGSPADAFAISDEMDDGNDEAQEEEVEVPEEIRIFWGSGYNSSMYEKLEERRAYWMKKFPEGYVMDIGEEALLKQICGLEVDINRDRAAGRSAKDNVNALNTLIGSANWKPSQKKDDADSELENMPLGVGLRKWEFDRPLPETERSKRDVRGTIKNITTWYLGHACKMVDLRNSYCKMYEDAMKELRVTHPEFDDEDDDTMLSDIFGSGGDAK